MIDPHPKLCHRPKPRPVRNRPKKEHPVLGKLEFVNESPGWWQSSVMIDDANVRIDVQHNARVTDELLDAAANLLSWIANNVDRLRDYATDELSAGRFRSNIKEEHEERLTDRSVLDALRPSLAVLQDDSAEFSFDCGSLPDGHLFEADQIQISIDKNRTPNLVFLMQLGVESLAESILKLPIPPDCADFIGTIPDQFIARAAEWGWIDLDDELRVLLKKGIVEVNRRIDGGSAESIAYMKKVRHLLRRIEIEDDV